MGVASGARRDVPTYGRATGSGSGRARPATERGWPGAPQPDFRTAAAAHELRAPLLGIRAAIETVLGESSMQGAEGILRAACEELGRLADVVDALLRFNGSTWSSRGLEVESVARAAIRSCTPSGTARIRLITSSGARPIRGDHRHLVTAVSNLVRNAVEHSRPGSEVTVQIGGSAERTTITIENATAPVGGSGSRATPGRPAADGHGFGLIIARRLVEASGGEIEVGSTPNRWTVSVNLPVLEEAAPPPQVLSGRAAS